MDSCIVVGEVEKREKGQRETAGKEDHKDKPRTTETANDSESMVRLIPIRSDPVPSCLSCDSLCPGPCRTLQVEYKKV